MEVNGTYSAPTAVQPPIGSPPNHQPTALNGDYNGTSSLLNGSEAFSPTATTNGNTFLLAPGIERSTANAAGSSHSAAAAAANKNIVVVDYSQDFPELPAASANNTNKPAGAWVKPISNVRAVKPNNVTQVFHLPAEERSIKNFNRQLGNTSEEQQKCNAIASATDTTIELCEAKDHTLTILITGKRAKVEEARARIVRDLQTQASREISIPKEHHRVLIGKEGSNLRQLEAETDCRIIVPGRDAPSDVIKVIGPREGIEKAVHQIELISNEQSKLAQEHLMIPRIFYPWIRGPYNETLDRLIAETGAKINIPPPSAKSEVIVVTGEKEGVYKAASVIRRIFDEQKALVKSVTCKVARPQHRYVIGPQRSNLSEVLKMTGVSVEVPSEEEDSDTITLRGDPNKLGEALTLVYAKASSVITAEVNCPAWLHKFIIGPKGATLQQIVANKNKVQVDFEDGGTIFLEGAPEEVKIAQEALTNAVNRLKSEMASETIKVHPSYHRHVIGKGGSLITKIKNETGVQITIPNESTNSDEIKVEGKKDGVTKAVAEISELVKRMENEKSKDMVIEQRFHKQIIGSKGESISKLREQYPSVVFSFPDPGRKSDIVSLRGDKNEIDKAVKQLTAIVKDLQESNYQQSVPIFKDFHKHIIGKGGANVRKIREETSTRIDLPGEGSGEDKITVTGKKANVEKAVAQLTQIQNELASIVSVDLTIPAKIHPRLLGGGRRLVQDIQDECGGVQIRFPPEKSNSDKVTIRGPKDDVARAQKLLMDLANDRELSSFEDSVTAKPEFHRFLIGKGGSKIKKVRESCPDVRILFPRESDKDQETIHLIGRKEEVAQVKKHLEELISQLNEIVEITTDVPAKWHKHFVARGANVLREIQDQFGGVSISFPRQNAQDTKVTIKGSKDCGEGAKQRIAEIVSDLEAQVTIKADIPAEYHRTLLGNRGQKVQDICAKYNVQIKFPDRETRAAGADHEEASGDGPSALNTVAISGRLEKCEAARAALQACIPISEVADVPFEFHGNLIGRSGETVRSLMQTYDVQVSIPPADQQSNEIKITGQAEQVKEAIAEIQRRVDEFKLGAKDRELRNFQLTVQVPPEYHQRLIGPRGQKINQMRTKHDVQISIPKQVEGEEPNENVVITGYEENTQKCKAEIEEIIEELKSLFVQEITLDARIHPRLIGGKGRAIRKVMDDYHVDIRFPRSTDPDPNLVTVTGKDEESVYSCIDHLRELEEEYMQDVGGLSMYKSYRNEESDSPQTQAPLQVVNAPWQVPDTTNMVDFPSMGGAGGGTPAANGVWGGQRRF